MRLELIEFDLNSDHPEILKKAEYKTFEEESFVAALQKFLADIPIQKFPSSAHIGIPCPVIENRGSPQNAKHWGELDGKKIGEQIKLYKFFFYNDFEIAAYSILKLQSSDYVQVNEGVKPTPNQAMTVMGPGTGLGVAILYPNLLTKSGAPRYKVWPCESGSVHFCPQNQEQEEYYDFLCKHRGESEVIIEHCFTGLAIPYMYFFFKEKYPGEKNVIEEELGADKFVLE